MPNFRGRRFTNAHETLIWAARERRESGTIHSITKRSRPATKTSRCARIGSIPLCTGEERLKGGDGKKLHPTQKPEALLARVILAASRPDDLVLDPFCGTGTTGAVAHRLRRRFIGIERDADYAAAAEQRIAQIEPLPRNLRSPRS